MSEEKKCEQTNEMLKLICEVEKNYSDNFQAQAELIKKLVNKVMYISKTEIKGLDERSYKDPFTFILDFMGRGIDSRKDLAKKILGTDNAQSENSEVLFLGIQNLTRAKFSHLNKKVNEECKKALKTEGIQECLKSIFCEANQGKECLKEISYEPLKELFDTPLATVTSVLYWLYPEKFIPFDANSKKLYEKMGLSCDGENIAIEDTWNCYGNVIAALKELNAFVDNDKKFKPSMIIALSLSAWLENNEVSNILDKFTNGDNKPKNIILTGIPGTGKTYSIMKYLEDNYTDEQYEFVQFHPSYDYEDFIEGLKPVPSTNEQIEFKLVNGVFKELCKKAFDNRDKTYVMVIDEINRANLSRVFGELLYCLEYRDEFVSTKMTTYIKSLKKKTQQEDYSVNKDNNIGKFAIPSNLIILGTMNEVDRSIDAFDLALRRRFIWEDIGFNSTALRLYQPFFVNNFSGHIEDLATVAGKLNKKLSEDIGANYQLGHTYYFKIIDYYDGDYKSALCDLWDYHIKSIVREYCKVKFGENELETKLEEYKKIIVGDQNCNG